MPQNRFTETELFRAAYLGKQAIDLGVLCGTQVEPEYRRRGIIIPVYTSSTLHLLSAISPASLACLARELESTHQITTHRVKKLEALGLIKRRPDTKDARRIVLELTRRGKDQARLLTACMEDAAAAYARLYAEIGFDVSEVISAATNALKRTPLDQRFSEPGSTRKKAI